MILPLALGLATGVAEYAMIRDTYYRLPRFSYVATTTGGDLQRPVVYRVNFIRGLGYRIEQERRSGKSLLRTTFWTKDGRKGHTWTQEETKEENSNRLRFYDVRLKIEDRFQLPEMPFLGPGPQLSAAQWNGVDWWQLKVQFPRGFSFLPDVYLDGKRHRRLAIHSDHGQRTVLIYEADRRRLREIREEWRRGKGYAVAFRTTYHHLDARTLTPKDVAHSGIVPTFPKMSLKPKARPGRDRPTPVRGDSLVEVADALRNRYGDLQTLRDTIEPAPGSPVEDPFHLSLHLDRDAGRRLLRRGPFETFALVAPPLELGKVWHVTASKGHLNIEAGENRFLYDGLTLGAYLVLRAWDAPRELDLDREGFKVRSDTWKGRPMTVLWRPVITGRQTIMGLQNVRPLGFEEAWIDAALGLIVRSRKVLNGEPGDAGPTTYEVLHHPQPNAKLTASDLEFVPSKVDAVKLVERELKQGGGRVPDQMRFEHWPR